MLLSAKEEFMPQNNRRPTFSLGPAATLIALIFLTVFGFAEGDGGGKTAVLVMIFTGISFGLPLLLFGGLQKDRKSMLFPVKIPSWKAFSLSVAAVFVLIFGKAFLCYALWETNFEETIALYGFTLSRADTLGEWILLILSVAILPAVLEELLFRGVVFHSYRKAGVWICLLMTSFLSALAGGTLKSFFVLFLTAFVYSAVRFLTGSILPSILTHTIYGCYTLLLEEKLWLLSVSSESRVLYACLLVLLFGLSLFWFLHVAETILRVRARRKEPAPYGIKKRERLLVWLEVFLVPPLGFALCVYLIGAILHLFVK